MKIALKDSAVYIDGRPVVSELRGNFLMGKARIKCNLPLADNNDLDILVEKFIKPHVEGLGAVATVRGTDMKNHVPFAINVRYTITGKGSVIDIQHGTNIRRGIGIADVEKLVDALKSFA